MNYSDLKYDIEEFESDQDKNFHNYLWLKLLCEKIP